MPPPPLKELHSGCFDLVLPAGMRYVLSFFSRIQPHETTAHQAPLSMGFSRQEYWSGLTFSSPGDLPDLGIEPGSPALQEDSLPSEPPRRMDTCRRTLNPLLTT